MLVIVDEASALDIKKFFALYIRELKRWRFFLGFIPYMRGTEYVLCVEYESPDGTKYTFHSEGSDRELLQQRGKRILGQVIQMYPNAVNAAFDEAFFK